MSEAENLEYDSNWLSRMGVDVLVYPDLDDDVHLNRDYYSINYLIKCGFEKRTLPFKVIKERMMWGTYGKNRKFEEPQWVRLIDCDTKHLENILKTQKPTRVTKQVIYSILDNRIDRNENN